MSAYRLYQVDAFTREKFTGNPAGVIANADGLSSEAMQRIARELNHSETAFIFSSNDGAYDVQVRFFTPVKEVPVCGHATIAAHYVRAVENGLGNTKVLQKTGAGILPVELLKEEDDYRVVMTQGAIDFQSVLEEKLQQDLLTALSLTASDLRKDCPVQVVSTGHAKVMVGIRDVNVLQRLSPNIDALMSVGQAIGCDGFYAFVMNAPDAEILVHGRLFAPGIGVPEDPVTGNAKGPLGAYLVHHNLARHDGTSFSFQAIQGEAMGRPGKIEVQVDISDGEPVQVRVVGCAVIVFRTELVL